MTFCSSMALIHLATAKANSRIVMFDAVAMFMCLPVPLQPPGVR